MNKRRLVVELEKSLINLGTATSLEEDRPGEFIDHDYRDARLALENARLPLIELGVYEAVKVAIDSAENLLKRRQFSEAYSILYKTYRELMKRSGTDERNARRYGKNGPAAQGTAMVGTADGVEEWGVLRPDGYGGGFPRAVSAAERDLVFSVEGGLSGLRADVMVAEVDALVGGAAEGKLVAGFQEMRARITKAKTLLEKLGVHAMLEGALTHALSLAADGEYAEAEQLLGVAQQALGDRCGIAALRARQRESRGGLN